MQTDEPAHTHTHTRRNNNNQNPVYGLYSIYTRHIAWVKSINLSSSKRDRIRWKVGGRDRL